MTRVGYVLALLATAIFWISAAAGAATNTQLDTSARFVAGGVAFGAAWLLRPKRGGGR